MEIIGHDSLIDNVVICKVEPTNCMDRQSLTNKLCLLIYGKVSC